MKKYFVFILLLLTACFKNTDQKENVQSNGLGFGVNKATFIQDKKLIKNIRETQDYLFAIISKNRHDLDTAVKYHQEISNNNKNSLNILKSLITLKILNNTFDEDLKTDLKTYLEKKPTDITSLTTLAVINIKEKDYKTALSYLKKANQKTSFVIPILKAWVYTGLNDYNNAIKHINVLKEYKLFEAVYLLHKALINDFFNEKKTALKYYKKLLETKITLRSVYLVANFYIRNNEKEKAVNIVEKYIEKTGSEEYTENKIMEIVKNSDIKAEIDTPEKGAAQAFFNIALISSITKIPDFSLLASRYSLYLYPEFDMCKILTAEMLEAIGQHRKAISLYKTIDENSSLFASSRIKYSSALYLIGKTKEAIQILKNLAEKLNLYEAYMELGNIYRHEKKYEDALVYYSKAIEINKMKKIENWKIYYNRANVYDELDNWEKAEQDLLKALEINDENPFVLNYLGYSWIKREKNIDKALKLIEKAVSLMPMDGNIIDSLGWALYNLGRFEEAHHLLLIAINIEPANPIINDHLGDLYYRMGRKREALYQWNKALSYDQDQNVLDNKDEIKQKIKSGL